MKGVSMNATEKKIERIAKRIVAFPKIWDTAPFRVDAYPGEELGKHKELHVHVRYNTDEAGTVKVSDGTMLAGNLTKKALSLFKKWLEKYRDAIIKMFSSNKFYRLDRIVKNKKSSINDIFAGSILKVKPLEHFRMLVAFDDGIVKLFDCKPFFEKYDFFKPMLETPEIFKQVKLDYLGDSIYWDDDMAFPADQIYELGKTVYHLKLA